MKLSALLFFASLALLAVPARADVLADFTADYQPQTPKAGWKYQWNTGSVTNPDKYQALIWNEGVDAYTVTSTFPDKNGTWYLRIGGGYHHPGPQKDSGPLFAIASYTLQRGQEGRIAITKSNINRTDTSATGSLKVAILVNDKIIKEFTVSDKATFDNDLGELQDGDVVSVAVGPDGSDAYDAFKLDFVLNRG
ncbi:MAG: hypothetical protein WDO13_21400 [Verrucomicrobiota bacterium]